MKTKALILLSIFLLNTFAGFSCALHMSHKEQGGEIVHEGHHHESAAVSDHHGESAITTISANTPCCQSAVNNFISLAKLVPASEHLLLQAPFVYISSFQLHFNDLYWSAVKPEKLYQRHRERRRLPANDIRIGISSLLI